MTEFFRQLQGFSEALFAKLHIDEKVSPWNSGAFQPGNPDGVILHYTASSDPYEAVRWFMEKRFNAKASANVVVADNWPGQVRELVAKDFPLVAALPTMVVQCVPPELISWHGTWACHWTYGIEIANAGNLKKGPNGWLTWGNNWTQPWKSPKTPVWSSGQYWEPYTPDQLKSVVQVLSEVFQIYPGLAPSHVLGHEQIQGTRTLGAGGGDKRDPGPIFPLADIRGTLFNAPYQPVVDNMQWFKQFSSNPTYAKDFLDSLVVRWANNSGWAGGLGVAEVERSWSALNLALRGWKTTDSFGALGRTVLAVLGYHIPWVPDLTQEFPAEVASAVRVFQRMSGILVDGIPGPDTRKCLADRIADRGYGVFQAT